MPMIDVGQLAYVLHRWDMDIIKHGDKAEWVVCGPHECDKVFNVGLPGFELYRAWTTVTESNIFPGTPEGRKIAQLEADRRNRDADD